MARVARKRYLRRGQFDRRQRSRHLLDFLGDELTRLDPTATDYAFTIVGGDITSTAHGLAVGEGPLFVTGGPAPLDPTRPYWVASATADTLALTSEPGGTAIPITGTEAGSLSKVSGLNSIFELLREHGFRVLRATADADVL